MKHLHTVKDVTEIILNNIPATRENDSMLYCYVLDNFAIEKWGNPITDKYNMKYILFNVNKWDMPTFETVRRARQKLQAKYPELRADTETQKARSECEKQFRAFSKEK